MSAKLEFQSGINQSVKFREAKTERVTSDAGIVLMAELLDEIGLIDHLAAHLTDRRNQAACGSPSSPCCGNSSHRGWRAGRICVIRCTCVRILLS